MKPVEIHEFPRDPAAWTLPCRPADGTLRTLHRRSYIHLVQDDMFAFHAAPTLVRHLNAADSRYLSVFARLLCVALLTSASLSSQAVAAESSAVAAAAKVYPALACACFDGSEMKIDKDKSIAPTDCPCPYAADVRKDLVAAIAEVPAQQRSNRVKVALAIEKHFLTRSPDYERMLRYDAKRYAWFLQNVRCTCEGCKATVYFSNCQLSCTPAVIYKRRARIWLAMGFSTETLITYYLNEYNGTHSAREQIEREWLLPKRQKRRGWMVPALLIIGAVVGLGLVLRRTVRKSDGGRTKDPESVAAAADLAANPSGAADESGEMSRRDRNRVLDALDDMEQDGGW